MASDRIRHCARGFAIALLVIPLAGCGLPLSTWVTLYGAIAKSANNGNCSATATKYDPTSGNEYFICSHAGGGATVYGSNASTASNWDTEIRANGDMSGRDASGGFWSYNRRTGDYYNSNGTTCTGHGAFRSCW